MAALTVPESSPVPRKPLGTPLYNWNTGEASTGHPKQMELALSEDPGSGAERRPDEKKPETCTEQGPGLAGSSVAYADQKGTETLQTSPLP